MFVRRQRPLLGKRNPTGEQSPRAVARKYVCDGKLDRHFSSPALWHAIWFYPQKMLLPN
jgi:hypothetical protein